MRAQSFTATAHTCRVEKFKLDSAGLKANEIVVKMVAAPITPVDLAQISGYAGKAAGPRVGGNEGVGIVEEAGASSGLKKGDMVAASRLGVGAYSATACSARRGQRQ